MRRRHNDLLAVDLESGDDSALPRRGCHAAVVRAKHIRGLHIELDRDFTKGVQSQRYTTAIRPESLARKVCCSSTDDSAHNRGDGLYSETKCWSSNVRQKANLEAD